MTVRRGRACEGVAMTVRGRPCLGGAGHDGGEGPYLWRGRHDGKGRPCLGVGSYDGEWRSCL
jgi:hypothetical protein